MKTIAQAAPAHEIIDRLALNLSKRRQQLAELVADYDAEILTIHRRYRSTLTEAAGTVAGAHDALRAEIESNRALFTEPKSWTLHGIQLGLKAGAGRLNWDDDDALIERIKKHFTADEAELLIRTKEEPIVAALQDLEPKILAKLGVRVESTGDVVYVRPLVADADKLLKVLLKESSRTEPKPAKAAKKGKA